MSKDPQKKPSINDVAQLAGVSKSTVSRFLLDKGYLSKEARKQIQYAVKKLGYVPSYAAKSLRQSSNNLLGVIVNRLGSNAEAQILRGVLDEAEQKQLDVIIAESQFSHTKSSREIHLFKQKNINYLIIFIDTNQDYSYLSTLDIPVVFIGGSIPKFSSVSFDNTNAINYLYTHLEAKGCQKIAFLGIEDSDQTTGKLRNNRYVSLSRDRQIKPIIKKIHAHTISNPDFEEAFSSGVYFENLSVDGIICATDTLAIGLLKYFYGRNIPKPQICNVGGSEILSYLHPECTSVNLDYKKAGSTGVELLFIHSRQEVTIPCILNA